MSVLARVILAWMLLSTAAMADDPFVPAELEDWRDWVLKDKEFHNCPFMFDRDARERRDFICSWPGVLQLDIREGAGQFSQQWSVYADTQWVSLPGNTDYWPDAVTANGRAVEVVLRGDLPAVYLEPGVYTLSGRFEWDERPSELRLPWRSALVELSIDGRTIDRPDRTSSGVFLGERERETQAKDSVATSVYRLVEDGVPTYLVTRLEINVSGSVREESFGPVLPDGFIPVSMNSQLPARFEPDGLLRIQVRPGRWNVQIVARGPGVANAVTAPADGLNLPDTEIWSYRSADNRRVTAPGGLPPVDPTQVDVPSQWLELPAFRASPGETLEITERSRGIIGASNELALSRTMWLDFDRSGFVVSDEINGTMRTDWRLDMAAPFSLLSASSFGDNLLVTDGADAGQTGVELRAPYVELESIGRIDNDGTMPVTGWDARFESAEISLNLPPGHKLLAAPGADRASGSWAGRWQLLDFFLVLLVTIAVWRLFGPKASVVALLAMVLSFHESGAPAWLWLNLLIAIALLRVAPAGKLRSSVRFYQLTSAAILILVLIPFVGQQLRIAIYPQLENQRSLYGYFADGAVQFQAADQRLLMVGEPSPDSDMALKSAAVDEIVVTGARLTTSNLVSFNRYAASAIVQAGTGLPTWQWNRYDLSWNGPIDAEQTLNLMILPRWSVTLLRFLEVIFVLLFAAILAAEIVQRRFRLPGGINIGRGVTAFAPALIGVGLLLGSHNALAQSPDPALLQELENRLLEPPECTPRCAEIVAADIRVGPDAVRMTLEVHAFDDVAVPLPGTNDGWRPVAIRVDGSAGAQIVRGPEGPLLLRVTEGRHRVELSGSIPAADSLEIPFPTPPRVVTVDSDGWLASGVKDRRLLSGSLQLTRLRTAGDDDGALRWESSRFPPFATVKRELQLDLDWYLYTTVTRVAPARGALTLEVPQVVGESVLAEDLVVEDGKILVSMAADQNQVTWASKLERVSPLELHAATGMPWSEEWRIGVNNTWHAVFSGVPESQSFNQTANARIALFYPRAGETLAIETTRPEASAGVTLVFDSVDIEMAQGERSSDVTLDLSYRSTRGAQHDIQLPPGAEVIGVLIDGNEEPLRAEDGVLTIPILPGEHDVSVEWRSVGTIGYRTQSPQVNIGAPSSNISVELDLPYDRWLLVTRGPSLGPAVLYWSELLVLILVAVILGRIPLTPLGTWQWLLLGLGFSTFSWPALAIVAGWLLVIGWRERWQGDVKPLTFNLVLIGIAGLTVIALLTIVSNLPGGLLGTPDMHVSGNGSYGNTLAWFADRAESVLPIVSAWTVPMWVYKALILIWALWLSFSLLRWLPWVWNTISGQGLWRTMREEVAKGEPSS